MRVQNIKSSMLVSMLMLVLSATANALVTEVPENRTPDLPSLNPDIGRVGEVRPVSKESEFRVCADPDMLPNQNQKKEGFEDKIAALLAKDLGKELKYTYAYNRFGFLRNTIKAHRCDVLMGVTSDYDPVRTTKPYYRTGYVFVYRKDSGYNITDWKSPDLKKGVIGIIDKSPVAIPLSENGLMANARPYRLQRNLHLSPGFVIDDLVAGKIDVAIVWGPIGGYFAKKASIPLEVKMIPEYENINPKGKTYWNISIGVRHPDKERAKMIEAALDRNKDKINAILDEYGIPHVPVVEGDSIIKVYKKVHSQKK